MRTTERNYFHDTKIYFHVMKIYFQGMKIYFHVMKIVFLTASDGFKRSRRLIAAPYLFLLFFLVFVRREAFITTF